MKWHGFHYVVPWLQITQYISNEYIAAVVYLYMKMIPPPTHKQAPDSVLIKRMLFTMSGNTQLHCPTHSINEKYAICSIHRYVINRFIIRAVQTAFSDTWTKVTLFCFQVLLWLQSLVQSHQMFCSGKFSSEPSLGLWGKSYGDHLFFCLYSAWLGRILAHDEGS